MSPDPFLSEAFGKGSSYARLGVEDVFKLIRNEGRSGTTVVLTITQVMKKAGNRLHRYYICILRNLYVILHYLGVSVDRVRARRS